MRTLHRNKRPVEYMRVVGTEQIGETLEEQKVYSSPIKALWNVSASTGEEAREVFGDFTNYSRTVSLCGECPVAEGDMVVFSGQTYEVVRIADSLNGFMIALKEVI